MRRLFAALALATVMAVPQPVVAAGVVERWPVEDRPLSVLVAPDGRVFVTNEGSATLSVVDPSTGTVSRVFVGRNPGPMALDAVAGRLYVSNSGSFTVSVVEVATLRVIATIFDAGGLDIAVDPATHRLYVLGGTTLSVFDTVTNRRLSLLSVGGSEMWFGLVHDAARHRLYITNMSTSAPSLRVLDDRDLSSVANVPLAKPVRFALAVGPTGTVYLASEDFNLPQSSEFYVVDPTTLEVTHTTVLGGLSAGVALDPSRNRIYVTDHFGKQIHELDDASFAVVGTIPLPWEPYRVAMHPDRRLYVAGFGGDELGAVALEATNATPVIESVTLSPETPRTNDTLSADAVAGDPDGDAVTLSYQWVRNGSAIPGATSATLDLSAAGTGDRGDLITVTVTASDGVASTSATASVTVLDTAPTVSVSLSPADPASGAALTATATAADADGDSLTYEFTWKVNGTTVQAVSSPNSSATLDLAQPGNGDGGDTVTVEVVASDGTLASEVASASVTVANSAPTATVSLSDETPWKTETLVASVTGDDADADALVYNYKWFVDGALVRETTTTEPTDSIDLKSYVSNGDVVTVSVTASDRVTTSSSATASAVVTPPGQQLQ